jgi:hypothetical protein
MRDCTAKVLFSILGDVNWLFCKDEHKYWTATVCSRWSMVFGNSLSPIVLPTLWPSHDIQWYLCIWFPLVCLMHRTWITFKSYDQFLTLQWRPNTLSVLNSPGNWWRHPLPSNVWTTNKCTWKYMNLLHYSHCKPPTS